MRNLHIKFLIWLLRRLVREQPYFLISDHNATHKVKHMSSTLKELQTVDLTLAEKSAAGNAQAPKSVPAWDTSDASIVTITPAADGLTAVAASVGPVGSAVITLTVDGLTATDEITVIAGDAATLSIIDGVPQDPVAVVADPVVTTPVAADPAAPVADPAAPVTA